MKITVRQIVYIAVMTALSVVANIFSVPIDGGSKFISFAYLPLIIAGIYMGPIAGGVVGGLGDILGCLINPLGPWMPLITLASVLLGVIPGIIFRIAEKRLSSKINPSVSRIILVWISVALILVVCTAGLNTFNLWYVYSAEKNTYWVYLAGRFPLQALVAVINGVLLSAFVVSPALDNYLKNKVSSEFRSVRTK